jgi:hypothetical protein
VQNRNGAEFLFIGSAVAACAALLAEAVGRAGMKSDARSVAVRLLIQRFRACWEFFPGFPLAKQFTGVDNVRERRTQPT